jgi:hypothetical protein
MRAKARAKECCTAHQAHIHARTQLIKEAEQIYLASVEMHEGAETWGFLSVCRGMTPRRERPSWPAAVGVKLSGIWGPPLATSASLTYCTSSWLAPLLSGPIPALPTKASLRDPFDEPSL